MKRIGFTYIALLIFATSALADELRTEESAKSLANSAMQLIAEDKIDRAFALITPHWPLPKNEIDTLVIKTIQQRNLIGDRFGKLIGYSFVREEKLSDFAIRYTFVEKRAAHVLRWQFTFYKPERLWRINSVTWDDNFGALFSQ